MNHNKLRHIRNVTLLLLGAIWGCDAQLPTAIEEEVGQQPITFFARYEATTKGMGNPVGSVSDFTLFGFDTEEVNFASTSTAYPNLLYNAHFRKQTDGGWVHEGSPLYWRTNPYVRYSFFAFSPSLAEMHVADVDVYISANEYYGAPTLRYRVDADPTKQVDLLYGSVIDQQRSLDLSSPLSNHIVVPMKHALSYVHLVIAPCKTKGEDNERYKITGLSLSGEASQSASLNLETGAWGNLSNEESYRYSYTPIEEELLVNKIYIGVPLNETPILLPTLHTNGLITLWYHYGEHEDGATRWEDEEVSLILEEEHRAQPIDGGIKPIQYSSELKIAATNYRAGYVYTYIVQLLKDEVRLMLGGEHSVAEWKEGAALKYYNPFTGQFDDSLVAE